MSLSRPRLNILRARRRRLNSGGSVPRRPNIILSLFRWIVILGGGAFILFHVLGLIYRVAPVPVTANMLITRPAGTELQTDWVRLGQVSPHIVHAVIAAEDSRFCTHEGIDLGAIEQAIADNEARERQRGGSTLTQQTAKNVFLWNGGGYARKGIEAYLALYIDAIWGKRRVMEVYLNVAEWGDGIYGIETAAQVRFGKSAGELTRREAALLASVLPSPNKWRVDPPGPYVAQRAATIESRAATVDRQGLAACVLSGTDRRVPSRPVPSTPDTDPAPSDDDNEIRAEESPSESEENFDDMLNRIEATLGDLDEAPEPEPQTDEEIRPDLDLNSDPDPTPEPDIRSDAGPVENTSRMTETPPSAGPDDNSAEINGSDEGEAPEPAGDDERDADEPPE